MSRYYSQFFCSCSESIHSSCNQLSLKVSCALHFHFYVLFIHKLLADRCHEQPTCCEPVIMLGWRPLSTACVYVSFYPNTTIKQSLCILSVCSLNCIIMHAQTLFSSMFVQLCMCVCKQRHWRDKEILKLPNNQNIISNQLSVQHSDSSIPPLYAERQGTRYVTCYV